MVFLDPNPIAFSLGPLDVRWYGIFAALMFLLVYVLTPWLAKRKYGDEDARFYENAIIIMLIAGLFGARLVHVLVAWEYYVANPFQALAIWEGGLTTHGGLLGAVPALWWWAKRNGREPLELLDALAAPFGLSLALGRVGNIMNQEILGDPCPGPWPGCPFSFEFGNDPTGEARHPVQLYAIVKNIVAGGTTLALFLTTKTRGIATAAWLFLYGSLRWIVEFYRVEPLVLGPLDLVQVATLPLVILSGAWLFWLLAQERRIEDRKPDAS